MWQMTLSDSPNTKSNVSSNVPQASRALDLAVTLSGVSQGMAQKNQSGNELLCLGFPDWLIELKD